MLRQFRRTAGQSIETPDDVANQIKDAMAAGVPWGDIVDELDWKQNQRGTS